MPPAPAPLRSIHRAARPTPPGPIGRPHHGVAQVAAKKSPARLRDVRLRSLAEGKCVQILHVGSFDDEGPVLERIHHEFLPENGLRLDGTHHEIYLSDVRRVAPEKRRTILSQPVSPAWGPGVAPVSAVLAWGRRWWDVGGAFAGMTGKCPRD
ncbi:GyrI-like domain-containing protein [Corynebacterium sp. AOP40-9SA-29]|uniref:GyrI-like domain-containing protein n=1 Tax=Corynebacterium sp. AOP40-9SA-29 TaxID=3457677 RepID=UPI0040346AA2